MNSETKVDVSALDKTIKIIVDRLKKVYNPQYIYLYGSRVWGVAHDTSDIDLFIVIEETDLNQAERIRSGLRSLIDLDISIDLLVLTKNEIELRKYHPSSLEHKILTKGVKLYEAA